MTVKKMSTMVMKVMEMKKKKKRTTVKKMIKKWMTKKISYLQVNNLTRFME